MAKITRYNGNLEAPASAALGTERTIFGTGSQSDDLTDQFNAFLLRGWGIVGPSDQPTLQDFNAMGFTLGQIHAYLHQMGVAEYNATQEYHLGSITNVAGVLYVSLVNTNVGNSPDISPLQWSPQSDHGMIIFDAAGISAWTVPIAMQLGIIKPKITVIGGGGGGGGGTGTNLGSGGGAGGMSSGVVDLTGVTSVSVTVGAGGAGGAFPSGNGVSGGSSSAGVYLSATAGEGGKGSTGANTSHGGAGGTGSGGTLNSTSGYGSNAPVQAGAATGGSGDGGASFYGGGGRSGLGPGIAGESYGSGGGGGSSTGGAGKSGIVTIEW